MKLGEIIEAVSVMSGEELERVGEAVEERRRTFAQSSVVERRSYGSGILQFEYRSNPKTGSSSKRPEQSLQGMSVSRIVPACVKEKGAGCGNGESYRTKHVPDVVARPPQNP